MALLKQIETSYQVPAEYWKIMDCPTSFVIRGYYNQEAREAEANTLGEFEYEIPEEILSQFKTALYNHLKTLPEWEGARDC